MHFTKRNKMQTDKEGSYDATSLSHMQHLHCIIGSSDIISVTFVYSLTHPIPTLMDNELYILLAHFACVGRIWSEKIQESRKSGTSDTVEALIKPWYAHRVVQQTHWYI